MAGEGRNKLTETATESVEGQVLPHNEGCEVSGPAEGIRGKVQGDKEEGEGGKGRAKGGGL